MTTQPAVGDPLLDLWEHLMSPNRTHLSCFYPSKITMSGIWTGDNPLDFSLPLILFQMLLITSTTRAATLLLSPLGLPRYISEILGGFVLGPSVLGRLPHYTDIVFPPRSIFILDSMALLGLVYYSFTIGVEIEVPTITRAGFRSFWFAGASALLPFLIGATTGYVALGTDDSRQNAGFVDRLSFPIFLGSTFASTAFSVLARNIAELKLAGTDVGQITLSTALINDTIAWTGLTVATALLYAEDSGLLSSVWTLLSGLVIFGASVLLVRPALVRLAQRATTEGEVIGEERECAVLVGVMVAALVADAGGTHVIFGAFVFGLAVPNGPVGVELVEKVEDYVVGTLLPLFFAMSGLRTDTSKVTSMEAAVLLMVATFAAAVLKVVACIGVAAGFGMPLHDGTSIGLLLNTKGVIELVILNIARNKKIMSDQSFTVLVFMSALITALVSPSLTMVVKPARRLVFYKRRTVAWTQPDAELRVLACVHVPRDAPAAITLVDVLWPSRRSPIAVHALHLIEFAGRASALLLINAAAPAASSSEFSDQGRSHVEMQFKHIAHAFMAYVENHAPGGVMARTMAAVSPAGSMTSSEFDALKERKADDGCMREFLDRANAGGGGVEYCERGVFNASEMVAEIRNVEAAGKDLFLVSRTPGATGLTAGMSDWSECPELGPIGDLLVSKDFQTKASVLVVQSYGRAAAAAAASTSSEFAVGEAVLPAPEAIMPATSMGHPPRRPRQHSHSDLML
ncbi:cation/H(+) antiporter 15-like [Triticum dicoccoides]|uniref:cation/H(+) antiporter 15-like n=1 Tax=Triticum dicoccoides TaxID=85692 RepID=UPI001890C4C0|nr:cation/H(+) antiporter 15-like [Triticum dicoccoides]